MTLNAEIAEIAELFRADTEPSARSACSAFNVVAENLRNRTAR
jgi:hypothetical protein